jgi:hypothetical protein
MQVKVMSSTINHELLSVADTSKVQPVFNTTPNIYIIGFFARVKEAFAGVTAPTVKLGTIHTPDYYIENQGIARLGDLYTKSLGAFSTVVGHENLVHKSTDTFYGTFRSFAESVQCQTPISFTTVPQNFQIVATFASSAGNLSALTAGEIEFVCVYVE